MKLGAGIQWDEISAVDIYRINKNGLQPLLSDETISGGQIMLTLETNEAVVIIPAGTNLFAE